MDFKECFDKIMKPFKNIRCKAHKEDETYTYYARPRITVKAIRVSSPEGEIGKFVKNIINDEHWLVISADDKNRVEIWTEEQFKTAFER